MGTCGSACRRVVDWDEGLFSQEKWIRSTLLMYAKGCRVRLVMSKYVSCVSGFSYRMYIDLNYCDFRI
jgi:hypothetical protein